MQTIGFGGGCHWCTEAVFQSLRGLSVVRQGFIRSDPPDDNWSEAIEAEFDPDIISIRDLLSVHLATHASTSDHKMRDKYRSAAYVRDADQMEQATAALEALRARTGADFVTGILWHGGFEPSDPRFHDYYRTNNQRPFCQTYIEPKLAILRGEFAGLLKEDQNGA